MEIKKDYDLSKLNTFGIAAKARFFAELWSEEDVGELFACSEFQSSEKIFLGGGSNVLLTRDWDGILILNRLQGIQTTKENAENVTLRIMGGEIWHNLVEFAVARGLWGIENLALIPGSVGAAPMQNIGAYGAELKDTLQFVEAYELATGAKKIFSKEECALGYRDSVFKNALRGKYFISAIILKLAKRGEAKTDYKILKEYLTKNNTKVKGPKDISEAVAAIRRSKLPDPKIIPNAGSFFKNVFVTKEQLQKLQTIHPDLPYFEEDGRIKIPAGWLIEKAGPADGTSWKGYREGSVGVHEKQALVLVNYGGATGKEILELANKIIASVKEKFNLTLSPEVNIV